MHERCRAAVEVLVAHAGKLGPADLDVVEDLLRRAGTWALVDPLAEKVAGDVAARHPEAGVVLDRWAGDPDLWLRRSALLALLGPLKSGGGDKVPRAGLRRPEQAQRRDGAADPRTDDQDPHHASGG